MSGAEPALIFGGLSASEAAAVASAMTAAEAAAAGTAASAAAYGAGGAATGEAVSGAYGLTAAELAAMEGTGAASGALTAEEAAMLANEGGGLLGEGANGMLSDPSSVLASDGTGNAFTSDFEKYKHFAKEGFRNVGKAYNKLPPGASNIAMQGLLGSGGGQQNTVSAPRPQGPPANPQPTAGLLGSSNQPLPKVTPYAPSLGGGNDAEEMKRRLMMMMGYA